MRQPRRSGLVDVARQYDVYTAGSVSGALTDWFRWPASRSAGCWPMSQVVIGAGSPEQLAPVREALDHPLTGAEFAETTDAVTGVHLGEGER
jgi:hypothetical protein